MAEQTGEDRRRRTGRGDQGGRGRRAGGQNTGGGGSSRSNIGQRQQHQQQRGVAPKAPSSSLSAGKVLSYNNNNNNNSGSNSNVAYPPHWTLADCLIRYNAKDPNVIRGRLRVLPARNAPAFCPCDRGSQAKDVVLAGPLERNRALDGDTVFVELLPPEGGERGVADAAGPGRSGEAGPSAVDDDDDAAAAGDEIDSIWWQEDSRQVGLWDPVVPIHRVKDIPKDLTGDDDGDDDGRRQRRGRVVWVVPPKQSPNEIAPPERAEERPTRRIVGTLKWLSGGTALLTCANRSMEQFRLSKAAADKFRDLPEGTIYQAKYTYGSWMESFKWPPCSNVEPFGQAGNVEDETTALLIANMVDHGDFPSSVLEECQKVVASGEYSSGSKSGWKPTPDMYRGRRDYRGQRIFTIDPTTAKDLDDALHVTDLGDGTVEIGVHIADVSYFVESNSEIDLEAQRRCTTVYLVDRTLPMLPRPLCEIACSLNENVERLAFSCVWRMNKDGSLVKDQKIWYGRTVIKSCARLDYATAQNIIEHKVANGENGVNEELWPRSRRPTGGHTIEEVAADVRLMNDVAQARRRMRFQNGAIALNAVKLTFKLDDDRETPLMCEPYPIRDSNKLVEEYMLLANYLVAQRLITHTGGRALLRNHEPPPYDGLEKVASLAQEALGFHIDITSSESLQRSLNRLGRECQDEIVLKCLTELIKVPMRPANYIAAGTIPENAWAHFALHIPYYTHFTSPIRRYADVIVHRLLQASLDGKQAVEDFPLDEKQIGIVCEACNEKKDGARKAQERSDVVFLALYLRRSQMKSQLGVVLSVGQKAFTVFVPSLGVTAVVYLDEHKNWIDYTSYEVPKLGRRIKLTRTQGSNGERWEEIVVKNFTKVRVTCKCSDEPPINVKLALEGPWKDTANRVS